MKDRINEIRNAIVEYCKENLNEQYKDASLDLLSKIEQKDGELLNSSTIFWSNFLGVIFSMYKNSFLLNI